MYNKLVKLCESTFKKSVTDCGNVELGNTPKFIGLV